MRRLALQNSWPPLQTCFATPSFPLCIPCINSRHSIAMEAMPPRAAVRAVAMAGVESVAVSS
jgi:hypothetical protein